MCKQTIVMGDRKRIGSLFCFLTNRARYRMAIRTQIRTRVDIPLRLFNTDANEVRVDGHTCAFCFRFFVRDYTQLRESLRRYRHAGIRKSDFARLQTSPDCQGRSFGLQNSAWLVKFCLAGLGKTITLGFYRTWHIKLLFIHMSKF
jgi:hypothetical protein